MHIFRNYHTKIFFAAEFQITLKPKVAHADDSQFVNLPDSLLIAFEGPEGEYIYCGGVVGFYLDIGLH